MQLHILTLGTTLLIVDKLGIERGYYTMKGCLDDYKTRIDNAKKESMSSVKTRRRIPWRVRKNKSDTTKEQEGCAYGGGKFLCIILEFLII